MTTEMQIAALFNFATIIESLLGLHAYRHRNTPGALPLAGIFLAAALWTVTVTLDLHPQKLALVLERAFHGIMYASITAICSSWLVFCLRITGRIAKLPRFYVACVAVVAAGTALLVATNEAHHLFWVWTQHNGRPHLHAEWGYWLFLGYGYLHILGGIGLLVVCLCEAPAANWRRCLLIVLAGSFPLTVNFASHLEMLADMTFDPTPFGLLAGICLLWWALFRMRILELIPMAQKLIWDQVQVGALVLDTKFRVLDSNPLARSMFQGLSLQSCGHLARETMPDWPQLSEVLALTPPVCREIRVKRPDALRYWDVRVNIIKGWRGQPSGYVLLVTDVTQRHQTEAAREELVGKLGAALAQVKTLSGLLPMCSSCKKIRDSAGEWQNLELYLRQHTDAKLTHGLCPQCARHIFPGAADKLKI
jgi:PAS domain-containing protein